MDEIKANRIDAASQASGADVVASSSKGLSGTGSDSFAQEMGGALDQLSKLENGEKLRDDAIQNAKAIIKNWTPPTDAQISAIFSNMRKELLA